MTTDNAFFERHLPGWQAWLDPSQDGPDMLNYRSPDGQRLNRAQFASWLQSTKVELGYASDEISLSKKFTEASQLGLRMKLWVFWVY